MQNKFLPEMLDDTLRIDSILFQEKRNTLAYYYTLLGDSIMPDFDHGKAVERITSEIKQSPTMAKFRRQKITFEYIYLTEGNKEPIIHISITPSNYK